MQFSFSFSVKIISIALSLVTFTGVHSQYYDEEEVCSSIGGDERNCVPLKYCTSLLNTIRNRPLLKKNLRKLVNLTCEFHLDEPKVCCPLEDVLETDLPLSAEEPAIKKPPQASRPVSKKPSYADHSYRRHPKFGLFPSFQKCSLSLTTVHSDKKLNGKPTNRGQFPWTALLGYLKGKPAAGEFEFLCGGTIVSKRYILTSAQCAQHIGYGAPMKVRLGEHDIRHDPDCSNSEELGCSNVADFDIEKIIVHKEFDRKLAQFGSKFEHDIALIRLTKDISFDIYMQPVCLPFVKDYDLRDFPKRLESAIGSVVGWGNTIWTSPSNSVMEVTSIEIKSNDECAIQYYNQTGVRPTQICAGNEEQSNCCGDSGSALIIMHSERTMMKNFQVGIASFGPFNCLSNPLPGLYTRVTSYLEWILDSIE